MSCGRQVPLLLQSPKDGKMRCRACHPMHLADAAPAGESDPRMVKAERIQKAVHGAIMTVCKSSTGPGVDPADLALIVQCLGLTAATFAVGAGIDEARFIEAMRTYFIQVRTTLGLQAEPPPASPLIKPS